jgi:transposase
MELVKAALSTMSLPTALGNVANKGYHSNATCRDVRDQGIRSYLSEPDRGKRNWKGKSAERDAVYGNRRRIRGRRGKALMRKRAEKVERSFAHCYETGGMRRTHLRGHPKILKRLLIQTAGFNLGLLMRKVFGLGTPRGVAERPAGLSAGVLGLLRSVNRLLAAPRRLQTLVEAIWAKSAPVTVLSAAA